MSANKKKKQKLPGPPTTKIIFEFFNLSNSGLRSITIKEKTQNINRGKTLHKGQKIE